MVLAVPGCQHDAGFEQILLRAAAGRLRCLTLATTMISDTAVVAMQAVVP
jgi:hypothetical protein